MKTLAISFAIGAVVGGSFISSTTTTNKVLNILIYVRNPSYIFLPSEIAEWLDNNGRSEKIIELVREKMNKEEN